MSIMESTGKKKPRPRRSFTPEFKTEIVELCRRGDRSMGQVAKDFDLTETAVRDWVRQAEVDAGERDGLTSGEREELAALRRENRRLREDVDILKRATLTNHLGSGPRPGHAAGESCPLRRGCLRCAPQPSGRHHPELTNVNLRLAQTTSRRPFPVPTRSVQGPVIMSPGHGLRPVKLSLSVGPPRISAWQLADTGLGQSDSSSVRPIPHPA
ncbi:transposase [Streptomyces polygonati]|uniref:Transposase n=1 Tax=Streptomyces polygonati TaxID=1617087 RepID=A0ABV8HUH1_9ACTN